MKWTGALLLGIFTEIAVCQDVKFSELMYAPSGGEPEWVELYNSSPDSVNVGGWKICNHNRRAYTLSSSGFWIPSGSYLVITKSDTIFAFHASIPSRVLVCRSLPSAFMVNGGDTLAIHDSSGALVDSVFYQSSWGGSMGKSLERISLDDSPFGRANWGSSKNTEGSTPGRSNSIAISASRLKINSFAARAAVANGKLHFKITVGNSGSRPVQDYSVSVFLDLNSNGTPDLDELAGSMSGPPLAPGDSTELIIESEFKVRRHLEAIALLTSGTEGTADTVTSQTRLDFQYQPKTLVVNEIMYAPLPSQPEWLELFNTSADTICLYGFSITDNSGSSAVVADGEAVVAPSEYVIVADDSSFFTYHPGAAIGTLIVKIPSLNNSGDAVILRDASGVTVDSVEYLPSWGGSTGGKSLERVLPGGSSNDPQNYDSCVDTAKSTPGKINSVTPRAHDLSIGMVSVLPTRLRSGDAAVIDANIVNAGLEPTGPALAILFEDLDCDTLVDTGEKVDSASIGSLPAGDSIAVSFKTHSLAYGSHRFGVDVAFAGDERLSNNRKAFEIPVGLPSSVVVLNEIMYAPKSPEQEWLEIFNAGTSVVDISGFRIVTNGSSAKIKAGVLIGPDDYAVICKDSSVLKHRYSIRNLVLQSVPSLNNGGDAIALYDNLGNLLDTVSYLPSQGGSAGRSLERIDYLEDGDSSNWSESADTSGATPGMENSVAMLPFDVAVGRIDLAAAPSKPGETGAIRVVIRNCGRNEARDVSASLVIRTRLDSSVAFTETKSIGIAIPAKGSAETEFPVSLEKSGSYLVYAGTAFKSDARSRNDTLSAAMNVTYTFRSLIINEIMFSKGQMGEYFEILNLSADIMDISGWKYHTSASSSRPIHDSGVPCIVPSSHYFVIAADSSVRSFVSDTSEVQISKSLSLRDDGDYIVITGPAGEVVDSVYYFPSWHNSDIANTTGRSLEKINPSLPSNERTSWSTSVSRSGGTPGGLNSVFVSPGQSAASISVSPNPFSPDGDGHDDFTFVNYTFPVTSIKVRLRIFDTMGRLIATPADNLVIPSTGRLIWDGRDGSGRIVRFGLYILFMEVTGPDGRSITTYKSPLVVAKRMR